MSFERKKNFWPFKQTQPLTDGLKSIWEIDIRMEYSTQWLTSNRIYFPSLSFRRFYWATQSNSHMVTSIEHVLSTWQMIISLLHTIHNNNVWLMNCFCKAKNQKYTVFGVNSLSFKSIFHVWLLFIFNSVNNSSKSKNRK